MDTKTPPGPAIYRTKQRIAPVRAPFWDSKIQALLKRGHCFLSLRFADAGHLFRGLTSGLGEALQCGVSGHFAAGHSLAELERRLGIYFVSNSLSDALAVAALHRDEADAGVFTFPARAFNAALGRGQAAVLAFAEAGLVFRYPFLCQPPRLDEADHLLVNEAGMERVNAWVKGTPPNPGNGKRAVGAATATAARLRSPKAIENTLPADVRGAAFVPSELRPRAESP